MAAENTTVEEKKPRRRRATRNEDVEEEDDQLVVSESKGKVTPGRRNQADEVRGNFITRPFLSFAEYLGEVNSELKKVSWPSREDTVRLTRIVLIVTIIASLLLGALRIVTDRVVAAGLVQPIIFIVIFLAVVGGAVWYNRRSRTTSSGY